MIPRGLTWRLGIPFVVLLLVSTILLAILMTAQAADDERTRMLQLAEANAAFIRQTSLPLTERLAEDLRRVSGFDVYFRRTQTLVPTEADPVQAASIATIASDGTIHFANGIESVAVEIQTNQDLILARRVGAEPWNPRLWTAIAAVWGVALASGWLVARGVVRPLRSLAAKLPRIEDGEAMQLPEADRGDEIGDLARAFGDARTMLLDEREQRARMEKIATLGRMTASLAHAVQNPIAAIKMHAQLLPSSDDASGSSEVIEQEATRVEKLVSQWLFLGRPEPPAIASWDLGELIDNVIAAHRARIDHARIQLKIDKQGDLLTRCDADRMGQVFDNLLANAIQAMPCGGELGIELAGTRDSVRVDFVDSGSGFSAQALDRFGEYFFSEKEGGMGLGIGVATEIVAAHGGRLTAENRASGGARVRATLPRTGGAPTPDDTP